MKEAADLQLLEFSSQHRSASWKWFCLLLTWFEPMWLTCAWGADFSTMFFVSKLSGIFDRFWPQTTLFRNTGMETLILLLGKLVVMTINPAKGQSCEEEDTLGVQVNFFCWRVCMFLFSMQFSYLSCPNYLDCKFLICGALCTSLGYKLIIIILKSRNKGNEIKIQFYYSCYMPLLCITLSLGLLKVIFLWLFMGKKTPMNKIKLN